MPEYIVFTVDDRAWMKAQYKPESPLWKFFADIESKMIGASIAAIAPGDTEYLKGKAAGFREILEVREYLLAPDTEETGGEGK